MALYNPNRAKYTSYLRRLLVNKKSFVQQGGFFVSDGGGENGVRIDYVERCQLAQRMRTKVETSPKE